ncbi:hydroxypyruvate isomerase family protein [Celeribacter sp. PS-C1]|uniref:hydroxypyruvate isomerase family protein n=1 Tax=Celeribacter sp. PS-C1 TaxID=2820813 RepID=UPI001CA52485|nr:TIM barrel protein [Celeribacter sp. PS-C1]MBW6419712.1 TIM barrel protein [Celeribacter sp. PS-C1]
MPKFAANLSFLFKEYPFLERFAEAKACGFKAVEVLFPYDEPASEVAKRMADLNLKMVLINVPPPNYTGGERGFAAVPGLEERFKRDFKRALRYAQFLGAEHMHIMAGKAKGVVALETYKRNLKWAAQEAPKMSLTIEPINEGDMPGYFLSDFDRAVEILNDVAELNLGLQFDAYHAQIITGDAMAAWDKYAPYVRHIQIAGPPDRHEPIKGLIDFPEFFRRVDESGYTGWISAEYTPKKRTEDGLEWFRQASS